MKHLTRLRRMTRHEAQWRSREFARTTVQRLRYRVRQPRWERSRIAAVLSDDVAGGLESDVRRERWLDVHNALLDRLLLRPAAFVLDAHQKDALRNTILTTSPGAAADAATRANRILSCQYDVLGYRGLCFGRRGAQPDWHYDPVHNRRAPQLFWADVPYLDSSVGDHKIIWELNRHQHFLRLGRALWLTDDDRYATAIIDQLESWQDANPPLTGINWASMLEIGFRSISWIWALHFLLAERSPHPERPSTATVATQRGGNRPWLVDMCVVLDQQLAHVEHHLSYYFSPNTHLTGEALALYVVGTALPELKRSGRWRETGRRILLDEIGRQIGRDGGHVERSTHYQRYTLDFYLLALLTANKSGDALAAAAFRDAAVRLAAFTRTIADDSGQLPLIGDDDGGMLWPLTGRDCSDVRDSLSLASIVLQRPELAPWPATEEVFWIAGHDVELPRRNGSPDVGNTMGSRICEETGYWVGRDGRGSHVVFDIGPHGYLNGGHAHADALAVTATVRRRPFLIDPGTSTYTMDAALRDRLRSSMCHNTVTLDGQSQSTPDGPFHWRTQTHARAGGWNNARDFDWAEACHDGYSPVRHRRSIVRLTSEAWLVVDELLGSGTHTADAHWHFHPDWMVKRDGAGRLHARHLDGDVMWLLHDADETILAHGDEQTGLGWYAPAYGTLTPTWAATCTARTELPLSIATWIVPDGEPGTSPRLTRLPVETGIGESAIATSLTRGDRASTVLLRAGRPARDDGGFCGVGEYQTNARVFHYSTIGGELSVLDIIDATHTLSLRDGWISIAADDGITHLHLERENGLLSLSSSNPPAVLRLQGAATRARSVRLNGREVHTVPVDAAETMIFLADQWGAASAPLNSLSDPPGGGPAHQLTITPHNVSVKLEGA